MLALFLYFQNPHVCCIYTEDQNLGMFPGASDERREQNHSLGPVEMVKLSHNTCV